MKKSQITVFIVLGIVIMIIFGLVFFIRNAMSGITLEKKINKIYDDFLSSTNIKHITNNCLDKTTKEALLLIGLQGGRIYDYQIDKGYHIESFYDVIPFNYTGKNPNGTIYNVSYGIRAPNLSSSLYPNPPDYPYPGSLVRDVSKSDIPADFFKSSNNQIFANVPKPGKFTILTDLCNWFGPNNPFTKGAGISCETYSIKNESIQEYLKQYIEQNIEDCINFTLKRTLKYNISTGTLSSIVLIGEGDLLVSLIRPIKISIKGEPPITKYLDFNIRPKIRLKILHDVASHLIGYDPRKMVNRAESNNIFFNITKDDPKNCRNHTNKRLLADCLIDGINVYKLPDYCLNHDCNFNNRHYNYSDIVIIEDNKSIIDGKPYRFQFAIENRKPALDFIDESVTPDKYYYWYINATYRENLTELYNPNRYPMSDDYNIVLQPGHVFIYPLGMDPDGDDLIYNYTNFNEGEGWPILDIIPPKDAQARFGGTADGDVIIRINVSDNEGLYDYQDVKINVKPI